MKKSNIFGIITLVLGILLILVVQVILPVCDKMLELANGNAVPMACHYTEIFTTAAGVLIIFSGVLSIFFRKAQTSIVLGLQSAALALVTILISTSFVGVCKNATMPCHMGTQPVIIVVCALIIVFSAVQVFTAIKKARTDQ